MLRQFGVVIAALVVTVPAYAQKGDSARKFGWLSDFNTAKAEAKKTGKPIFLVFR